MKYPHSLVVLNDLPYESFLVSSNQLSHNSHHFQNDVLYFLNDRQLMHSLKNVVEESSYCLVVKALFYDRHQIVSDDDL
jgi:hypothetical protein